jgi:hypothetical protein
MIFCYAIHERVPDYLRCGWLALPALEGTHHGFYAVLMAWLCQCKIPVLA